MAELRGEHGPELTGLHGGPYVYRVSATMADGTPVAVTIAEPVEAECLRVAWYARKPWWRRIWRR